MKNLTPKKQIPFDAGAFIGRYAEDKDLKDFFVFVDAKGIANLVKNEKNITEIIDQLKDGDVILIQKTNWGFDSWLLTEEDVEYKAFVKVETEAKTPKGIE